MTECTDISDGERRCNAIWLRLIMLAVDAEDAKAIAEAGGIKPLIKLLDDASDDVRMKAADLLRILAVDAEDRKAIAEAGGIKPLIKLLGDASDVL